VLDFEAVWANHPRREGSKATAITDRFGITEIAYLPVLNRLLDSEAALAHNLSGEWLKGQYERQRWNCDDEAAATFVLGLAHRIRGLYRPDKHSHLSFVSGGRTQCPRSRSSVLAA
jgi:hypothetical protein